jgi:lipopolysaccharide transport system ATP-binding protein
VRKFRGSLKSRLFRLAGGKAEVTPDSIAALKGISFKVEHGERVGLIGRNGSGKTTMLRALAGVYPLRSGLIEVRGGIRTLLDLRHGFESESTGRENLFYRALALGIAPEDIRAAEEEIIEFADIGKFIDLPISTYSAGMVLRLGFAVSTQFAPDVLLIDEIFAAGDASFSERAVERMNRILAQSGIMMMASHSMPLMRSICTRVIWLDNGAIRMDGEPDAVATAYLSAKPERRT